MPPKFDSATISIGYVTAMRTPEKTYCRRCGRFQPREGGALIKMRMRNGQVIRQFICGPCQVKRTELRAERQAFKEREALQALYGQEPATEVQDGEAAHESR